MDIRDKWLGIKRIKGEYKPMPYHRRDKQGNHINWKERAQTAAEHPRDEQWGQKEGEKIGTTDRENNKWEAKPIQDWKNRH